jgi:hypothetical protein
MKVIKRASQVRDGLHYLRRHGSWFRPDAAGYTDDIGEAGTYTADVARNYMQAEGVTAVTVKSMRNDLWKEVQAALARASRLAEIALR